MSSPNIRLQSGMRTHFTENVHHGNKISKIELGRVAKVNYETNSIGFFLLTTGADGERASADKTYSAMLPMSMAGRNSYGKAYGDITPIRVGDIVLIAFVDDKTYRPIVLGIYPDEAIASELCRVQRNDVDPSSVIDYALANASFKVYPDQTYDYHDGQGTRILTFSGHSFFIENAEPVTNDNLTQKTDDSSMPLDYKDLTASYFGNGELIEPISDKAPEILFKHEGIVDGDGKPDTHALYLYVGQDGTYRVSQMKTDEDWRTYFEIKNSKIHLVRQKNSKTFGGIDIDNLQSSEIGIDDDGNVVLRNHNKGITVKTDGLYALSGEKLITTKNAISDLILDKLGSLGFGGANLFSKSTATRDKYLDSNNNISDMRGALVSDYIECIGNNAYYTYAYGGQDDFGKEVSLSLVVYDSNKKYIEGKEVKRKSNVQINTRSLPVNASYLRVSISDGAVPLMLAYGEEYSAYQPSYADTKASKNSVSNATEQVEEDYLAMKSYAIQVLQDKTLAMNNIKEAVEDSQLSSLDKQALNSYLSTAKSNYDSDVSKAVNYEINIDKYKAAYNQLLGRLTPLFSDMSTSIPIVKTQIIDLWDTYYSERYNLAVRIQNSAESVYESNIAALNTANSDQSKSMIRQFTNVTQTLQSITQATEWTIVKDDIDLNNELKTENILFKGNKILNSPVKGAQYIQVYSARLEKDVATPEGVTQKVWSVSNIASYSRVYTDGSWSDWVLDSDNGDYNRKLVNIANSVYDIDGRLVSTKNDVNDLTSTTESIKQQITNSSMTLTQYMKSNNARVDTLEKSSTQQAKDTKSLSEKIDQCISSNNDLLAKINNIIKDNSALTDKIKETNQKVTDLTNTLTNSNSDISSIKEDIVALKERITNLESKSK